MDTFKASIKTVKQTDLQQQINAVGRGGEEINERSLYGAVGLYTEPKEGDIGVIITDEDSVSMVAVTDKAENRPDDLENTTTLYKNKDSYVKIKDSGEIIIANSSNRVILKSNGDIELGDSALKALVNESFKDEFDNHVHNFIAAPSGAFSTSTPAKIIGTIVGTPVGGAVALFLSQLSSTLHLTQKTKAQ